MESLKLFNLVYFFFAAVDALNLPVKQLSPLEESYCQLKTNLNDKVLF